VECGPLFWAGRSRSAQVNYLLSSAMNQKINACCAECGVAGGVSLKVCKSCMDAKYCNAECQKKHWATHKADCKRRTSELRDEALFKDPPPKEECPICFLPMPDKLIYCVSLPPATIMSIPIYDFAIANKRLAGRGMEIYYSCCGKSICGGCVHSFRLSGNLGKCPHCKSELSAKTKDDVLKEVMNRVAANDPASMYRLAHSYEYGLEGFQQDRTKSMELYARAAALGFSKAHHQLGGIYDEGGDLKKAKFHCEAAAMAGHKVARYNLGMLESNLGNMERAVKHWMIAASAGGYHAMYQLITLFKQGLVNRESVDLTLASYNDCCAEMRSKARDAHIIEVIEE
jgi:TPR repeat protein